jgi:hypothetical protein
MKISRILLLLALLALTVSACANEEPKGTPEEKLFHDFPYNLSTG